jgi:5-methylcytosine-specific restriction protein B
LDDEINEKFKEFKERGYIEFITFHPSYCYEEFMEGITVHTEKEGEPTENIQYKLKSGIFKTLCKRALGSAIGFDNVEVDNKTWKEVYEAYIEKSKNEEIDFESAQRYVLIIDEINRGDISKIFGELITLLEKDKRLGAKNELTAMLPYSNDTLGVPPNLYIIGTMNTADRSIALLDVALRRRFAFKEMKPDFSILEEEHIEKNKEKLEESGVYKLLQKSKKALEEINSKICMEKSIGRDKQIGHSFLFHVETPSELIMAWQNEILPLLEEYCYSNYSKINKILFNKEDDSDWIKRIDGIIGFDDIEELESFLEKINTSG